MKILPNVVGCMIGIVACIFAVDVGSYAINAMGIFAVIVNAFSIGYDAQDGEHNENDL